MKIAMIFPEVYDVARFYGRRKEFPPFGVLYLSTILEDHNHEVEIFSVDSNRTNLSLENFDVVAFSIPSSITYHVIKNVRERSSFSTDSLLIAGGVHATIFPEETLIDLRVDVVGIGPGEETILEIISKYSSKDFSDIESICYSNNGHPVRTGVRKLKRNLDHLPTIPARHLLPESDMIMSDRLSSTSLRMTHVMLTQGCPYSCNFCASQQKKMQYRSGWHVQKELVHLIKAYSIEGFAVVGDNFLVNKEKARNICEAIKGLALKWSTLSRVDTVEYDIFETMLEAGCIEVKFGMESGSSKMLKAMGKNISVDQICNAIKISHSIGINVKVFLIHGYPGENMRTTNETIEILKKMSPMINRISLFRFAPLPGSPVYQQGDLLISKTPDDWSRSHIHHNHYHWWGSDADFEQLSQAYKKLDAFVSDTWQ